jgi:hypothetical protein
MWNQKKVLGETVESIECCFKSTRDFLSCSKHIAAVLCLFQCHGGLRDDPLHHSILCFFSCGLYQILVQGHDHMEGPPSFPEKSKFVEFCCLLLSDKTGTK